MFKEIRNVSRQLQDLIKYTKMPGASPAENQNQNIELDNSDSSLDQQKYTWSRERKIPWHIRTNNKILSTHPTEKKLPAKQNRSLADLSDITDDEPIQQEKAGGLLW